VLASFEEPPVESTEAGNPIVLKVKQQGQKTSLAEQGTPRGTQEEK